MAMTSSVKAALTRSVDEQWREPLHPAVDRDVINTDTAFGEEFLGISGVRLDR